MTLAPPFAQFAVDHLINRNWPDVALNATGGASVNVSRLSGMTVVYAYPRTSPPNGPIVHGWSDIPGAKGCTPQSCGFRDHFTDLQNAGVDHVFGLSTQTTDYQNEVVQRLHLPFALLSDADLTLQKSLELPVFEAAGLALLHRVTLIIRDGIIKNALNEISDPATNATDVIAYVTGA